MNGMGFRYGIHLFRLPLFPRLTNKADLQHVNAFMTFAFFFTLFAIPEGCNREELVGCLAFLWRVRCHQALLAALIHFRGPKGGNL